jgi:hypothetical protein
MLDQILEGFRKAAESSTQAQRDMMEQYSQQWRSMPISAAKASGDWMVGFQKRVTEAASETLHKQQELIESTYRAALLVLEQVFRAARMKSPEELRPLVDETWSKLAETIRSQSDAQLRELQNALERWLKLVQSAPHE